MRTPERDLPRTSVSRTVADTVLNAFQCLPKTGKPQGHEHTVLAGYSCTKAVLRFCCKQQAER